MALVLVLGMCCVLCESVTGYMADELMVPGGGFDGDGGENWMSWSLDGDDRSC